MVLSEEQKRARKREYMRKYYEKNREKVREYNKEKAREYYENNKNKEKLLERNRLWKENNKEKISEQQRKYRKDNKEKLREANKNYSKTDDGIKSHRISKWKQRGLVDNFDKVYERWEYTLFCDLCRCDLDQCNKSKKCMDHDHASGLFRNILCHVCNIKRR